MHWWTAERMYSAKHSHIEDTEAIWPGILSNYQDHKSWSRRILYIVQQNSNDWVTSKTTYQGCRQTWSYIKHTTVSYGFTTCSRSFDLWFDSKLRKNHGSTTEHLHTYIWACKACRSYVKHINVSYGFNTCFHDLSLHGRWRLLWDAQNAHLSFAYLHSFRSQNVSELRKHRNSGVGFILNLCRSESWDGSTMREQQAPAISLHSLWSQYGSKLRKASSHIQWCSVGEFR